MLAFCLNARAFLALRMSLAITKVACVACVAFVA